MAGKFSKNLLAATSGILLPKKRPRFDDSESDDDREISFERQPTFFRGPEVTKIGNFRFKLAYHPTRMNWFVFFRKSNKYNRAGKYGDSYLNFPAQDIDFVIGFARKCIQEIRMAAVTNDRAKFSDQDPNSYKSLEFWHSHYSGISPSELLIMRPFTDQAGSFFLKFLSPRQSTEDDWLGSSVSMSVCDCKEFIKLLELYQVYIRVADNAMKEKLQNTTVDALDDESIEMTSPTKEMLSEAIRIYNRPVPQKKPDAPANDSSPDGPWYVLFPENPDELEYIRKAVSDPTPLDLSRRE
jgi:hypothetical protein